MVGESGTGKSTLIRAIAGLWPWGEGQVLIRRGAKLFFMPQRAYVPIGTLKRAVAYPTLGGGSLRRGCRRSADRRGARSPQGPHSRRGGAVGAHAFRRRAAAARLRATFHPAPRHHRHGRGDFGPRSGIPGRLMQRIAERLPEAALVSVGHIGRSWRPSMTADWCWPGARTARGSSPTRRCRPHTFALRRAFSLLFGRPSSSSRAEAAPPGAEGR